jgi:DNA-binding NarL/FixJ family response regulator
MIRNGAQVMQRIDKLDTDLKRLRSTERYSRTPVVLMTTHDSNALGQTAARHAAPVYCKKPTTFDDFMELGLIVRRIPAGGRNSGEPETALSEESAGSAA